MADRFRFRPRYGALAWGAVVVGGLAAVLGGGSGAIGLAVAGGVGLAAGLAYLASPTWRYVVVVDDDGFEVVRGGARRFRVAWSAVVRVVASPTTTTCFVDGGEPAKSLLVPGDGAPAAYDLERKAELYRLILGHVAADRVREVATLEAA